MGFRIQENALHYYVDLLRGRDWNETGGALHNIIRTMKAARHNKICGEDFSRLDFGNIPFNVIHWSIDGECPSCFNEVKLNEWNFRSGHSRGICGVAYSPNGKLAATASHDNTVILWDMESGLMVRKIEVHTRSVRSVAFSPNGKYFMTDSQDNTAKLWSIETGRCIKTSEKMHHEINNFRGPTPYEYKTINEQYKKVHKK